MVSYPQYCKFSFFCRKKPLFRTKGESHLSTVCVRLLFKLHQQHTTKSWLEILNFQALEMEDNSRIKFMDDEDSTTSSEEENISTKEFRSVAFDLPQKVQEKIDNNEVNHGKPCQREKKVTPIPRQVSDILYENLQKMSHSLRAERTKFIQYFNIL